MLRDDTNVGNETLARRLKMATRQQRIDEFTHDGAPPADQPLEILCEDHVGTYLVPFPCRWTGYDWTNADTGERIEVAVLGWRALAQGARPGQSKMLGTGSSKPNAG
jgi:hypothetical protein